MPEQKAGLAQRQSAVDAVVAPLAPDAEFTAFYRTSYRDVRAAAMAVGATEAEADDAVQIAMQDLMTRWSKVRDRLPYTRRAAINAVIKSRQRQRSLTGRLVAAGEFTPEADPSTDAAPSMWEDAEQVRAVLADMPPAQREVFALVFDQFTPKEIAGLLGKTQEAVRQNLFAARKHAKATLAALAIRDQRGDTPLDPPASTTSSAKETR